MSRPSFAPTVEQRRLVEQLTGIGCTQDEVLHCVPWGRPGDKPVDGKTLRKHFADELQRGTSLANMRLKKTAFDLAVEGDRTMLIFLLKVRCGYSETVKVEATGRDGAPLTPLASVVCYLPVKDALPDNKANATTPPASQVKAALPPWQEPPRPPAPPAPPPEPAAAGSVRPLGIFYPPAADPRR